MKHVRATFAILFLSTIVCAFAGFGSRAAAAEIKWKKYMQSAANVSAIAAAVAWVDSCSKKPLMIEELNDGDGKFTLTFTCLGKKDGATAIIHFDSYGAGSLFPSKFGYAG